MHELLEGRRNGREVTFVKRYDDINRAGNPVHYSSSANGEGTEIAGTWEILGNWSGTFLMIRSKPEAVVAIQQIAEPVR